MAVSFGDWGLPNAGSAFSLKQGLSVPLSHSLQAYYDHAAHRHLAPDTYVKEPSTICGDVLFFRGMLHFEPAAPFVQAFRQSGYRFRTFRFHPHAEDDKLRQWPRNSIDFLSRILQDPDFLQPHQILLAHSAGGNELIPARALSRKINPGLVEKILPKNGSLQKLLRNDRAVARAAQQLSQCIFLSEGSPLLGVRLTLAGRMANRTMIDQVIPDLLSCLTYEVMSQHFDDLRLDPKDAMDGVIYSETAPLAFSSLRHPKSLAIQALTQGAYRLFSPFLNHEGRDDGIVSVRSARLPWNEPQRFLRERRIPFDHLGMVEYPEAANHAISLIQGLQNSSPSLTQLSAS